MKFPFKLDATEIEVTSTEELCDDGIATRTVGDPASNSCSYEMSVVGSVSSAGVTARASATLYHCPGSDGATCTANFDLTYTKKS
jgi:hypothetical protein